MYSTDILKRLVAIPSDFPNEQALGSFIVKYLRKLGFKTKLIFTGLDRPNIVATYGKSDKFLGFYGHLDTVAPDENYHRDPYSIWSEGDHLRGLGVADMKGGLAVILELASYATKVNLPLMIVLGVDEENISEGAHDLINSGSLANLGFLISAESGQVKNTDQPYSVCYGRRGRVSLDILVSGKKSHAADDKSAINAIEQASKLIMELDKIPFKKTRSYGKTNIVVHSINGNTDSFSVPDKCSINLSALTTPETTHQYVLEQIGIIAKRLGVSAVIQQSLRSTPYAESYAINLKNTFYRSLNEQIFQLHGVEPIFSESVADENVFANSLQIPVISIGPIGGGDHTSSEWVSELSLKKVFQVYQQILTKYAGSES